MSSLPARNRVIYQSEALFVSPDTTGHHVYYKPNYSANNTSAIISGKDASNNDLFFHAYSGLVSTSNTFNNATGVTNWTFDCTGNKTLDTENALGMSGLHPILTAVGFSGSNNIGANAAVTHLSGSMANNFDDGSWGTVIEQIKRVQNANYSFTINRQDINQFGHLGRLDSIVLEAPTVSLDFSYYLTDGGNERLLGMSTDGGFQNLSGVMTRDQNEFGNNYFILTVPEGRDAVLGDELVNEDTKSVISLGNGYVTDYSIEASVGAFPTVSVTVDGMNIKSDIGTEGKGIPAIDPKDGTLSCDRCFFLPPSVSGEGESVLKPGDITINLQDAGLISKQISGDSLGYGDEDKGSAHIQSFTLSTPMGRTDLQRLGNTYAFAKELDFPITCTLTVNALVADLKDGNLVDLMCGESYNFRIKMQPPQCVDCDPNDSTPAMQIDFRRAKLDSESFSSAIGDNKTVDLTFSTQIGGPEEQGVGVFISGWENSKGEDSKFKMPPTIENTGDHLKYFPYGHLGTTGGFAQGRY